MATTRREQILARSAELFAARGFHGVSVDDVGAACGISGPALYRHFASKDAMLAEMLVGISELLLAEGTRRVETAPTAAAALDALVGWHVEFALRHQALIVVQDRDWTSLPAAARKRVRTLQTAYIDLWVGQLLVVRPELERPRAKAQAQAVFGLLNSTPRSARLPDPTMREVLAAMAAAALRA